MASRCRQCACGEVVQSTSTLQSNRSSGAGSGPSFVRRIIKQPESFVTALQQRVSKMGLRSPFPLGEKNGAGTASQGLRMRLP